MDSPINGVLISGVRYYGMQTEAEQSKLQLQLRALFAQSDMLRLPVLSFKQQGASGLLFSRGCGTDLRPLF